MRRLNLGDYDRTSVVMTSTTAVSDLIRGNNDLVEAVMDMKSIIEFQSREIHQLKEEVEDLRRNQRSIGVGMRPLKR